MINEINGRWMCHIVAACATYMLCKLSMYTVILHITLGRSRIATFFEIANDGSVL